MRATFLDNGDTSDSLPVTNGVKQGCVLAPTLFSMVFAAMLHDASRDNDDGIQLKYRTDEGVFNLRLLKAKTKVKVATLRELLFADDCALNRNTQRCIHHPPLQKENRQLCDNYRGISRLAIEGKILARVMLNRLIVPLVHGLLPESQCGFRGG